MRPQSSRRASNANHLVEVFFNKIAENDQAWRQDAARIGDGIAAVNHDDASSNSGSFLPRSGFEPFQGRRNAFLDHRVVMVAGRDAHERHIGSLLLKVLRELPSL